MIDQIAEEDWVTIEHCPDTAEAQIAETKLKGWRLIVRRTRLLGAQAELSWLAPPLLRDQSHRPDHGRRHRRRDRDRSTIEVIRDLKDQALAPFPCGLFHANSAWTVTAALAPTSDAG